MAELDLDLKHADYTESQDLREKARTLFAGEAAVMAAKTTYLFKTANETTADYDIRLARAYYKNWSDTIITARQSLLWRKGPTRTLPDAITEYIDDVDNGGLQADTFFANVLQDAQVDGLHFVLVDKSRIPEGTISKLDEKNAGVRTYFRSIAASNVYDWNIGADGKLLWAIIAQSTPSEERQPGQEGATINERLVWDRQNWTLYQNVDDEWQETASAVHGLGFVPLVPFYGNRLRMLRGEPITKDILQHVIALYNKSSDRDFAEFLCNNPKLWIVSQAKPAVIPAGSSNGVWLPAIQGIEQSLNYLEPSGVGIEASRKSEYDIVRSIVETGLRQARRDTAQVQAADSIKAERREFSSSLVTVATLAERAEQQCWEFWAAWDGITATPETLAVSYNTDFDDDMITAEMMDRLSTMVSAGQLTNDTQLRILAEGEALPDDFDVDEEVKKLQSSASADTAAILASINTPTGDGA